MSNLAIAFLQGRQNVGAQNAGISGLGSFGNSNGNPLSQLLGGLGKALQGLSDMLGGKQSQFPSNGGFNFVSDSEPKKIAGEARIHGDPHFDDPEGGKFDVQGQAGKTYNLLSDKGFQMNGRFDALGGEGATGVGEVGIKAGGNTVSVDKSGKTVVNGEVLKDGQRVGLAGGGYVEKKGDEITVKKGEWQVDFQTKGDHLNLDVKTKNAIADGVRPHGLIGQTFDGDGKARNGDKGSGVQGGGAIEDVFGNITKSGDKNAVKSYEVNGLFDNQFLHHNKSGANNDRLGRIAMASGFSSLALSLLTMGMNNFGSNRSYL